jgi:hypothetical protein
LKSNVQNTVDPTYYCLQHIAVFNTYYCLQHIAVFNTYYCLQHIAVFNTFKHSYMLETVICVKHSYMLETVICVKHSYMRVKYCQHLFNYPLSCSWCNPLSTLYCYIYEVHHTPCNGDHGQGLILIILYTVLEHKVMGSSYTRGRDRMVVGLSMVYDEPLKCSNTV